MKGLDKVNWNVFNILDDKLESENFVKTLNIGTCTQHTTHGTFKDKRNLSGR